MSGFHTVEKIGGTSMTRFGDVMKNVIIGKRSGDEFYNRIFVVSAYGGITNLLPVSTVSLPWIPKSGGRRWKRLARR